MKKTSAKNETQKPADFIGHNEIIFKGKVRSVKGDKVKTIFLAIPYKVSDQPDKVFNTSAFIKAFAGCPAINCEVENLEEGDIIQVACHQVTKKYNDKYYNELVADVVEYFEE